MKYSKSGDTARRAAILLLLLTTNAYAVTRTVKQAGGGTCTTIQACVDLSLPGDTVEVYAGTYRELVTFDTSGTSETARITLTAAPGQLVKLRASNAVTGWTWHSGTTYKKTQPETFFATYNPFRVTWPAKPSISSGGVFIGGVKLAQSASLAATTSTPMTWWADLSNPNNTLIYANIGTHSSSEGFEILKRRQVIKGTWNRGYITVRGLNIGHGSAPKDVNFYLPTSQAVDGALATHGGHHWIIEDCTFEDNHGVALDYGLGGGLYEQNNGLPSNRGAHIIRNNIFKNNDTNGAFAFKGSFTEIYGNVFVNNNALNTGLVSEGYLKNVDEGPGINIHDNYFYSNQSWATNSIWLDTESQANQVVGNTFVGLGNMKIEKNLGYNLVANNVFVGGPAYRIMESSHTYIVHNLMIHNSGVSNGDLFMDDFRARGGQAYDWDKDNVTQARHLFLYQPGTRTRYTTGTGTLAGYVGTYPVRYFYNKLLNNIVYTQGAIVDPGVSEPATRDGDTFGYWGNLSNYNVFYNGAQKIAQYGTAHSYTADAHSVVIAGNTASASSCTQSSCSITMNVDASNKPTTLGAPRITGASLGNNWLLTTLGVTETPPDIVTDYYGAARTGVVVGPFARLNVGSNTKVLWPKNINNTSPVVSYSGTWTYNNNQSAAWLNDITFTRTAGSSATFTFYGTLVKFYYKAGPSCGIAQIWLDGVQKPDLDTYAATATQQVEYSLSGLAEGYHTLKIVARDTGPFVQLDAFKYQ